MFIFIFLIFFEHKDVSRIKERTNWMFIHWINVPISSDVSLMRLFHFVFVFVQLEIWILNEMPFEPPVSESFLKQSMADSSRKFSHLFDGCLLFIIDKQQLKKDKRDRIVIQTFCKNKEEKQKSLLRIWFV